jgi:two-component system nitrate/nitrite sensor histidine kinase NarX
MRIAQETLANIRKHAKANVVRMLLTFEKDKGLSLLIEDDGVGFDSADKQGKPGEHVGLTIMEERADRLGGTLRIESEAGEGTQVELHYQPSAKSKQPEKRWII